MKKSLNLFSDLEDNQKAFTAIFLGALLGGATSTVTKIGLLDIPPFSFVFLRFLIASICLIPIVVYKKKTIKAYLNLAPLSLLATINILLFIIGIRITTATIGQLLYAATPFLTGVILYVLYKEKLARNAILGIIIGFLGTTIVVVLPVIERHNPFSGSLLGNLLISTGVISWSFYMVYSKKILKKYSPFDVTSSFIFVTALVSSPFFIAELFSGSRWWGNVSFNSVASFGYVTIVSTIVTYFLNQYAIKHGGSVFASMSFYLLPIFAFLFAFLLLGEHLTPGLFIGGLFVLFGIFLVTSK